MIAVIIAFCILILSFSFFTVSYQIIGVNRLVLGAPISLFETAINMYGIDETEGPYFDKETLVHNITYYFDYHMPRYTKDYTLDFYYYNIEDHSLDMSKKVKAVEVGVNANLTLSYHYQKTMYYEIRSN